LAVGDATIGWLGGPVKPGRRGRCARVSLLAGVTVALVSVRDSLDQRLHKRL
jgi:hypothetical protein